MLIFNIFPNIYVFIYPFIYLVRLPRYIPMGLIPIQKKSVYIPLFTYNYYLHNSVVV